MLIWFNKSAIEKSETKQSAQERINKINEIIDTLIDAQLQFTADPHKKEYRLDDGQTKVSVMYQDITAISAAIIAWERTKQIYLNRINGNMVRLVDSKNMPNFRINNI